MTPMGQGPCVWAAETHAMYVSVIPCRSTYISSLWQPMSTELRGPLMHGGVQWDSQWMLVRAAITSMMKSERWQPKEMTIFHSNQNLLKIRKEGTNPKKHEWPFLFRSLPYISHFIYAENYDIEGKEKIGQPLYLFLSVLPYLLLSAWYRVLVECVQIKTLNTHNGVSIATVLPGMKYICMYEIQV